MTKYKGVIISESLTDIEVLDELDVTKTEVGNTDGEVWHLYTVAVPEKEIDSLARHIKPGWYMHFWKNRDVIAVFKDKIFKFNFDDKGSWKPILEYGRSRGIPDHQLDFPID